MTRTQVSKLTLVAVLMGGACSGCASSEPNSAGSGGASGGSSASGGATTPGTGGAIVGSGGTPATTGGAPGSGGARATGGAPATGGTMASTGGSGTTGGAIGTGGVSTGGRGGSGGGANTGGANAGGTNGTGGAGGSVNTGTCTASKAVTTVKATGSGPHKVTVETNSDTGIKAGTIYRPTDLGGTEKYPIFAWGEGGCSLDGASNAVAMTEIASHGYFVIADGTPGGSGGRTQDTSKLKAMGQPLVDYITWAIAENEKPCSAYFHSLDTTKISTNGFSCGGLMSEGAAYDPRLTTWGLNSSGLFAVDQPFYKMLHTPVLLVLGGTSDMAYPNGSRDYDNMSALGLPVMFFSKNIGHGGDLTSKGGDFAKIDLAWLNWQLKGDLTATGKGLLVGTSCPYCKDAAWEVKSKNIP